LVEPALDGIGRDLAWLDRLLQEAVDRQRARFLQDAPGVYIAEHEVDALLALPSLAERTGNAVEMPYAWHSQRLELLSERCSLTGFDKATLLLALAPALHERYGRIYAYLNNDLNRPFATAGLALELFAGDFGQRAGARSRFQPSSPLRAPALLRLEGDESQPLIRRPLGLDEAVVDYLLGAPPEPQPAQALRQLVLTPAAEEAFQQVLRQWTESGRDERPVLVLSGEGGSGRKLAARHLARAIGTQIVVSERPWPLQDLRAAALSDRTLCLADADDLFVPEASAALGALEAGLRVANVPLIVCAGRDESVPPHFAGRETTRLRISAPGPEERRRIWLQESALHRMDLDESQARLLATTFRLNGGRIARAASRASVADGESTTQLQCLAGAAKREASTALGRLGQEISPRFHWDDIVLPPQVEEVLREIVLRVRHEPLVFGEWGFTTRHARNRSFSALFTGPSGTGKTMAAEVIANALGLTLFRVDLSAVVSKYIGETEKNLAQIFDDASSASAVLFFDEADALFGKRSEVRDSHDRYANIEVSYLLQRLEDYDGIAILASNLRQNLDEAFVRRLHLTADFPFPDAPARLEIWRRTLPSALPLAADVDLPALARRFRLSGGNIRNACVSAAFFAAEDGPAVTMSHLLRAVRREHQKMGKLLRDDLEQSPP
jgi:AAA+ superfamily predicted ATPase